MKKTLFIGIGFFAFLAFSAVSFAAGARDYHIFQNRYQGLKLTENKYRRSFDQKNEAEADDQYVYTVGYDFDYENKCLERWGYSNHPECKERQYFYYGGQPRDYTGRVYRNIQPGTVRDESRLIPLKPENPEKIERVGDEEEMETEEPEPMPNRQPQPVQPVREEPTPAMLGDYKVASDPAPDYKDEMGARIITNIPKGEKVTFEVVDPNFIWEKNTRLNWEYSRDRLRCYEKNPLKMTCTVKIDFLPGTVTAEFVDIDQDKIQESGTSAIEREMFKINP